MAEKEGFEPSIPFWGIHDFQSCALGQLRDFSITVLSVQPGYNTTGNPICQAQISLFREFLPCRFSAGQEFTLEHCSKATGWYGISAFLIPMCRRSYYERYRKYFYIMAQKHRQRGIIQPTEQTKRKRRTFTGYGVFLYVPYSHALYQRRSAGGSVIGSRISPPRVPCPTGRSLQS